MTEARCMRCKKQQSMKNTSNVTMKNGRKAMKGECVKCDTKMFRILGKGDSVAGGAKKSKKSRSKKSRRKSGGAKKSKKSRSKKSRKKSKKY